MKNIVKFIFLISFAYICELFLIYYIDEIFFELFLFVYSCNIVFEKLVFEK